jgi:hypothetical protein
MSSAWAKLLWLVLGIIVGMYVIPAVRAKTAGP